MDKQLNILITGARAPIALELARAFHRAGHRVYMADAQHLTLSRWSNSVYQYLIFPSPTRHTEAFIRALEQMISEHHIDHLIPTCEEAFFISRYRQRLLCKAWVSPFELMHDLHNKDTFIKMARPFFAVPETISADQFDDWANSTAYVFKQKYSRFATTVIIGAPESACAAVKATPAAWIAQQRITGREVCVYSVWDHGILKAYACYHPLYRFGKGAGIYFQPVDNPGIFNSVQALGKATGYNGQLCFDVIISDGVPYVRECTPRGTSGAHLLGHGLATAFFGNGMMLQDREAEYCISYAMAMKHLPALLSKRTRQARDVIFSRSDPAPFLMQVLSIFEIGWIKLRTGVTWLQATTGDIEWNGTDDKMGDER